MRRELDERRFAELVGAYGTDLARFPDGEREPARDLLERSEAARALIDSERPLDRELTALGEPHLPSELEARLLSIPREIPQPRALRRAFPLAAFGWAAAAALGLWIGTQSSATESGAEATVESALEAESATLLGMPAVEDEETSVALALGSFAELEEEP